MGAEDASPDQPKKRPPSSGMVLGPDGKPCKICTAFRNWKPQTSSNIESDGNNKSRTGGSRSPASITSMMAAFAGGTASGATTSPGGSTNVLATTPPLRPIEPPPGCPPDVEQLGRATWAFLHTTAAYYPDKPTPKQRANMLSLLHALPILYPCTWCAQDLGENMTKHPPDVSSRTALSQWLCTRHNEVNERLGKEIFECSKVDERWRDGPADGSCD